MTYYKKTADGFLIEAKVVTRSSRSAVTGVLGGRLKICLKSPPVEGRANDELTALIAERFGLPRKDVVIVRGRGCSNKKIVIRTANENLLKSLL
ncbi:MAG: DUF167 domain-containing protein [Candidatus Aureabacteria bacterium]|nr:DUF167 domain-containing protein [Candidatus Auribacterota bacterium]